MDNRYVYIYYKVLIFKKDNMIKLKNLLKEQGAGDTSLVRGLIGMTSPTETRFDDECKQEAMQYLLNAVQATPETLRSNLSQLTYAEQSELHKEVIKILRGNKSTSTDSDANNNGYPDETESDVEARRANMGYGQGRYQGD